MTPEQSIVASAVHAWKTQLERTSKLFSALTDAQLGVEIAPGKNRLVYLWGHLIAVHDGMLPLLGLGPRLHPELDAVFLTAPDRAAADVPTAAELQRMWDEVNDRLHAGFGTFAPTEWVQRHTAVSEEDFAVNPLRNKLAILLSRTAHVAYHLGQAQLAPQGRS
jgi:hypothetical protein